MNSVPAKVSTATVLPPTSETLTCASTKLPSCRRSSMASGSRIAAPLKVTVRLLTIERWAEPSLMTTLSTVCGAPASASSTPSYNVRVRKVRYSGVLALSSYTLVPSGVTSTVRAGGLIGSGPFVPSVKE